MVLSVGLRVAIALGMALSTCAAFTTANAKTPGHEYCFHSTCHTVKTLEETRRLVGVTTKMKASFYDDPKNDRYNPSNITSSGEYFRSDRPDNAASPIYPDGTKLLVWHPASGKALMIRVNNAGPYWGDRKLDLSRAAAEKFGFTRSGVASVHVKVVEAPSKAESTYKHGRNYPSVKGYMGQFASIEHAATGVGASTTRLASNDTSAPVVLAAKAPATPLLPVVAEAMPQPKARPAKLSLLDIRMASNVQQQAAKFLVAQRIQR